MTMTAEQRLARFAKSKKEKPVAKKTKRSHPPPSAQGPPGESPTQG
jgi:hypothetical protein